MKLALEHLLTTALASLRANGVLPPDFNPAIQLDRTRDKAHGDWATNLALASAKAAGRKPRDIAEAIVAALPANDIVSKVEIAGPGFINFFLAGATEFSVLGQIFAAGAEFGRTPRRNQKLQVEFVSANPTSSLHVGHGRGAAYGMTVATLLDAVGYDVQREYYVNDAGRQMAILATSTYLRYVEAHPVESGIAAGAAFVFPSNGYRGDYIRDIAASVTATHGATLVQPVAALFADVPADAVKNAAGEVISGDKETHIDGLIANARTLLGSEGYDVFFRAALDSILSDIRQDLGEFGVHYDEWFSEKTLETDGSIERAVARLTANGHTYEQGGAIWFRSTTFGDDKDRVLVRDNGQGTYFASDVAYHLNKFERGFDRVVNIWGADHHGYITRVKAALTALGLDAGKLDVLLVQFVSLWRGGEQVQMSSRSGQFIPLRELREEVGNDAARFYYITRKSEQHIDFDLDLAVSQSKDNPVYYIQYAHARVCSMLEKLTTLGWTLDRDAGLAALDRLDSDAERDLAKALQRYPEVLLKAAEAFEPHQLSNYLKELASEFHGWYNSTKVLVDDEPLRQARLTLSLGVRQVIANGLGLLGVAAPERM
ncbi:MAG: arginine--tRNA ligase [Pseudomonadota bacterium]